MKRSIRFPRTPSTLACLLLAASAASAQTWDTSRPPMPVTRLAYAASIAEEAGENQIFVFGGTNGTSTFDEVHSYHRTLHWSALNPMPAPRHDGMATTALDAFSQERIYFFGGGYGATAISDTCWAYDAVTDAWNTSLAPMPTLRSDGCAVTGSDGWIYVFGGRNAVGQSRKTVERYDPVNDLWQTLPDMAYPRRSFGAVAACDGYIYLFGGETGSGQLDVVEVYQPGTGFLPTNPHTLTPCAPMPTVRSSQGTAVGRNGRIYLVGGSIASVVPTDSVISYDPWTNTWQTELPLPTNRSGMVALGMGSRIWVPGGYRKLHPNTPKLETYGALPNNTSCDGIVPSLTGYPWGSHLTCVDAVLVERDDYVYDLNVVSGTAEWIEVEVAEGQNLDVLFENHSADSSAVGVLWSTCGAAPIGSSSATGVSGQQLLSYTNDTGAPQTLRIEYAWPGNGSELELEYDLNLRRFYDELGTNYCGPAVPNSSGMPAAISAAGDTLVVDNDLTLTATSLPVDQFGYFVASETQAFIQGPGGSQGNLCIAGTIARFVASVEFTGEAGSFSTAVDLTAIPTSPISAVAPGDTWNFQAWFRDNNPGSTSNFTDAVSITFE